MKVYLDGCAGGPGGWIRVRWPRVAIELLKRAGDGSESGSRSGRRWAGNGMRHRAVDRGGGGDGGVRAAPDRRPFGECAGPGKIAERAARVDGLNHEEALYERAIQKMNGT